ncbi:hypothetical protein D3C76_1721980 [compost metagenome]
MLLRLLPAGLVVVQLCRSVGQAFGGAGHSARPGQGTVHGFGADRGGDAGGAAEHGIGEFALDPGTEAQRRQADPRIAHHL